tara:strand:- start:38 stop:226 length:189 start_codon:yes stop_codon:yes gene_type:complete
MVKEIISRGWIFLADHGVSATLRDLGRMGLLVLNDGKVLGNEVIPVAFDILQDAPMQPHVRD